MNKTEECWLCGKIGSGLEECKFIRADGKEIAIQPIQNKKFRCSDIKACDIRSEYSLSRAINLGKAFVGPYYK